MRPIERGPIPVDDDGNTIQFIKYKESRGHLLQRFGSYCSYCERFLGGDIAVEHIQPKKHEPGLALEWNNFLLACRNCNSIKNATPINLNDYYWADQHNTFRAFTYGEDGLISVNNNLAESLKEKAKRTLKLTGLDRTPNNDPHLNPENSDRRWDERRTAWGRAVRAKNRLQRRNTVDMIEQIIETALATGFWSVWMTIFDDDADMLRRLIHEIPGTCRSCFDGNSKPIERLAGVL